MITLHGIEQITLATAGIVVLIAAPIRAFAAATRTDKLACCSSRSALK